MVHWSVLVWAGFLLGIFIGYLAGLGTKIYILNVAWKYIAKAKEIETPKSRRKKNAGTQNPV